MRLMLRTLLLVWLATVAAFAQTLPTQNFQHIIVIVQENRTPDNLFQGLCVLPYGDKNSCSATNPTATQYNIQTKDWKGENKTIQPQPVPMSVCYDLGHGHNDFLAMCHMSNGVCLMDGAEHVECRPGAGVVCAPNPQFKYVRSSDVKPYLEIATQYGWANYMFQTNQGPSFPAHQFIFGGTSAPTPQDDLKGIFASENMGGTGNTGGTQKAAGCVAAPGTTVKLIQPPAAGSPPDTPGDESATTIPCFEHKTMADLLPPGVSWKYYAPNANWIWTAPNAIQHICQPSGGQCTGPAWTKNVDIPSAHVLQDIADCKLRSVSWVIPTGHNSDHAAMSDGGGPSWVASIVNAIGASTGCDGKTGYWNNTAIFVTWDDWGGWYDHEPPTILPSVQGYYQYGFRVPLIAISAYTPKGHIDNVRHDFGSILRFIQHNFGIAEGSLKFADARATSDLTGFFNLKAQPRAFNPIAAAKNADFFLHDKRPATDPDDE